MDDPPGGERPVAVGEKTRGARRHGGRRRKHTGRKTAPDNDGNDRGEAREQKAESVDGSWRPTEGAGEARPRRGQRGRSRGGARGARGRGAPLGRPAHVTPSGLGLGPEPADEQGAGHVTSRGGRNAHRGRGGKPAAALSKEQRPRGRPPRAGFAEYWPSERIEAAIQAKTAYEGVLRINRFNTANAYVTADGLTPDALVPTAQLRNRALEGDSVVIELLTGRELALAERNRDREAERKTARLQAREAAVRVPGATTVAESTTSSSTEDVAETPQTPKHPLAKVVAVTKSFLESSRLVTGELCGRDYPGPPGFALFRPNNVRVPLVQLPEEQVSAEVRAKADSGRILWTVELKRWAADEAYPTGTLCGPLGQRGELPVETEALLEDHDCNWGEFGLDAIDELPPTPWSIGAEELKERRDFRGARIFSVDPPTARDLDDALSVRPLRPGVFEVGVHIADVSHFVPTGGALDAEAQQRATTVYLVQKAIPMLPRLLSEELCSLNPGVERLAFSTVWEMDADGHVLSTPWFGRSVIRSCAKLSYDHAQAVIEGRDWSGLPPCVPQDGHSVADVAADVRILHKMALKMRARRFAAGALTMQNIKLWFSLDSAGNPSGCGAYEQKHAHRMIEEFMLLANMAVATRLAEVYGEAALLRRHEPPEPRKLGEFVIQARELGYSINVGSAAALQASFDAIPNEQHRAVLRLLCIKPMRRARYFSSGDAGPLGFTHYALNVPAYTHFTSPIRRYCDLVVHRMLDASLRGLPCPYDPADTTFVAALCNRAKDNAKGAQDDSGQLYLLAYLDRLMKEHVPPLSELVAMGIVFSVQSRRFAVLVPAYGVEEHVYVSDAISEGAATGAEWSDSAKTLIVHWRDDHVLNLARSKAARRRLRHSREGGGPVTADAADEAAELIDAMTLDDKSAREKPKGITHQTIAPFTILPVRISTCWSSRPPKVKLRGMHPDLLRVLPQTAIVQRELKMSGSEQPLGLGVAPAASGASLEVTASCPAMVNDAD